jgi:hypothetical protein
LAIIRKILQCCSWLISLRFLCLPKKDLVQLQITGPQVASVIDHLLRNKNARANSNNPQIFIQNKIRMQQQKYTLQKGLKIKLLLKRAGIQGNRKCTFRNRKSQVHFWTDSLITLIKNWWLKKLNRLSNLQAPFIVSSRPQL